MGFLEGLVVGVAVGAALGVYVVVPAMIDQSPKEWRERLRIARAEARRREEAAKERERALRAHYEGRRS